MKQSELYLMVTIVDRERLSAFVSLYKDKGLETHLIMLGHGTALPYWQQLLALTEREKAVILSVVTGRKWLEAKKSMYVRLGIAVPGNGIAFAVPLSAVGGKRELMFLTDGQDFHREEESSMKGTEQQLLMIIGNQGYNEMIMDAARGAGAGGGTVIHAKGTGMQKAEQFLGITLASEKDVVLIVTPTEKKNAIMQAVMKQAGPETKAGAIVFSLPVEDTAGIRLKQVSEELNEQELEQGSFKPEA